MRTLGGASASVGVPFSWNNAAKRKFRASGPVKVYIQLSQYSVLSLLVFPCTKGTDARALLKRAPPFIWLSEVCAILDAFSQLIKQVRLPLCLPGCIHRYIPSVTHCAPSHNSFAAPCLPNSPICAGGTNVPFLERHVSKIAEPLIPRARFCMAKRNVMAVS